MTVIWCIVPEVWSATDRNICHSSHDAWFLRYGVWRTEFFFVLDQFLPFYPLNNLKNQNFEKMKKTPGDISILHIFTKNDNYMMYGSWDTECNGQNFLSFWTIFCPFTPLTAWKIKILKNWKIFLEILSFYTSVPYKWQSYDAWFLRYEAWRTECFIILDQFLSFYPLNPTRVGTWYTYSLI